MNKALMTANFLSFPPSSTAQLTPYVLLEKDTEGLWKANILGWSDCEAKGSTREEALSNLRQALTARLEQAEIVPLELSSPDAENPWLRLAGKYKDDPHFEEMLASIETYRRELDADTKLAPYVSFEQLPVALNTIRDIRDEHRLADLLTKLAPLLSPQQLTEAISIAQEIKCESIRADLLTKLAPLLSPQQLTEALSIIREIEHIFYRFYALIGLVPHLSSQLKQEVLIEALSITREMGDEYDHDLKWMELLDHGHSAQDEPT
jgi:predicted RNase H-like HicB family nuclease